MFATQTESGHRPLCASYTQAADEDPEKESTVTLDPGFSQEVKFVPGARHPGGAE